MTSRRKVRPSPRSHVPHHPPASTVSTPRGITIIEILVIMTVLGVLAAIVIPSIQVARSTSRRMSCTHHLRQLGLALHSHLTTFARFPQDNENCLSWHVTTLPMLELTSLHNDIRRVGKDCWKPETLPELEAFQGYPVPTFHCPADPFSRSDQTNYLGNTGSGYFVRKEQNGVFSRPAARPSDFIDGLSNTAAIAEFRMGQNQHPVEHLDLTSETLEEWKSTVVPACQQRKPSGRFPAPFMGVGWLTPGYPTTTYSHVLTPGGNSCKPSTGGTAAMIATPRSFHPQGVNILMADGHTRFVSVSVDLSVWRQIGSRDDSKSFWDGSY